MDPITTAKASAPFLGILKDMFKGVKEEFIDWFQLGISEYIEDRNKKFYATNTFISRNEKVNFYDVYFPLNLKNSKKNVSSDNILDEIFSKTNCGAILGVAGSGKTMLMKHAFLQSYNKLYSIPIFIELRDLNTLGISLLDYIYTIILKNKIKPSSKIVERALEKGGFIFFFDGFDEINLDLKEKLVLEIEHLVDHFNKNKFLLSSRPGANAEALPRFQCFIVQPLTNIQIINFIQKQLFNSNDEDLISKLTASINVKNKDYIEYLTNPLLLSMYILTYRSYPELPKSKNKFYWNVFDTLCTKHDSISKKGAYIHQKKSKLQNENFETILCWFCYISVLESRFNFDEQYLSEKLKYIKQAHNFDCDIKDLIYDLTVSISILIVDGLEYKFPHRTIQDYFMVLFIKDQNDQAKELIYTEKFQVIHPTPSNKNIFDLCNELDKEAYLKYYILPLFEKFINSYNNNDITENVIQYLKEMKPDLEIKISGNEITMQIGIRYLVTHIDVASFYGITPFSIYPIKAAGNLAEYPLIRELVENQSLRIRSIKNGKSLTQHYSLRNFSDDLLKRIVSEYLDLKKFEIYMENMRNQYLILKEELKKDQQTKNSLIDFVHPKNI